MACRLRKTIGAVKDQTSIGLAKVSNAANLEVNILKSTTHDEVPMEERYVNEIVLLVSSNKVYAAACAQSIGKRIGKTRNWVVALKFLVLVLRIFQDGDPYFPREIFHAMKRGAKILNLSTFKDDSTINSWDYTSFVRTFALYLDERLDCFLTGKLQRRFTYHHEGIHKKNLKYSKMSNDPGIKGMKPTLILDRITHWQKLLDRAVGSRLTGSAKNNNLIKICLYAIVQESFDLYRHISDGLSVILDSFFLLPYKACVIAFKACVKSSKQFDELSGFYAVCSSLGVGRTSEYPSVQKVSDELMETLQEFLKDQASLLADNDQTPSPLRDSKHNPLPPLPKGPCSIPSQREAYEQSGTPIKSIHGGSQCASLKDLMIVSTDADLSSSRSIDKDEKQSQNDKSTGEHNSGLPIDQTSLCFDLVIFDDFQQVKQHNSQTKEEEQNGSTDCWDLVLAEIPSTPKQVEQHNSQTRDQEQKNTTLSSNNGSTDCWDLMLAELASTPKQVEQQNYQTKDQELKNASLSSNNGSLGCWDLVLAELPSTPKQVEQHNNQKRDQEQQKTTSDSNNGSKDCWDLVLAEIGTKPEPTSSNKLSTANALSILDTLFDKPSSVPQPQFNSFLENMTTIIPSTRENYKASFANCFDLAPTFQGIVPRVSAQNPHEATIAPAFTYQSHNSQPGLAPTLGNLNRFKTSPTFTTQNLNKISTEPAFYNPGSYNNGSAPLTFHAHNETNTTPTFNTQNVNMTLTVPALAPQNANKTTVPSAFWAQDFDGTKSFCAKNSSETTMTTLNNSRDDPFEMWINAMTNNKHTSNEWKQQSLLQQQQKWLEQRNQIMGMKTPQVAFDLISRSPSSHATENNYQ